MISKYLKKIHLFTPFSITSRCFSLCLASSKSMLALLPFKTMITPRHSNPVPDSMCHLADLKSITTESWNAATPWRRVNWKMWNENSTFACFDAICTEFSVTWPHCITFHDFLAVLTDPDCRYESDFAQRDGSDSTCGRRVHAVQNKTPEQTSACLTAYVAIYKIACYKQF